MDAPKPTSSILNAGHCARLRHKGMYVMAEPDPDDQKYFDPYEATAYWCARTATSFGPDGHPVTARACQHHRGCCE